LSLVTEGRGEDEYAIGTEAGTDDKAEAGGGGGMNNA